MKNSADRAGCYPPRPILWRPKPPFPSFSSSGGQTYGNVTTKISNQIFLAIRHLNIYHNAPCLPPKVLHKHCFQFLLRRLQPPWGGGVLPYITYTGMCRTTGSWFWSSRFKTGYPFQRRFLNQLCCSLRTSRSCSLYFGWFDLFSRDPTFTTSRIFVHGFCS